MIDPVKDLPRAIAISCILVIIIVINMIIWIIKVIIIIINMITWIINVIIIVINTITWIIKVIIIMNRAIIQLYTLPTSYTMLTTTTLTIIINLKIAKRTIFRLQSSTSWQTSRSTQPSHLLKCLALRRLLRWVRLQILVIFSGEESKFLGLRGLSVE